MRYLILPVAVMAFLSMPLSAQEGGQPESEAPENGRSLIEDGARMLLDGFLKETGPALRDMSELAEKFGPHLRGFAESMGPALAKILKDIDDLSLYEPPEKLPNGDIIIRRKTPDATPEEPGPSAPKDDDEIEI